MLSKGEAPNPHYAVHYAEFPAISEAGCIRGPPRRHRLSTAELRAAVDSVKRLDWMSAS